MKEKNKKMIVYEYLKEEIVNDLLKPLEVLNEKVFARELNVSKTPIREALQQLEKEGFVESIPQKGYLVSQISVHDIWELYQIREMLECSAITHVALDTDRDTQKFELLQNRNPDKISTINETGDEIHQFIIEGLHNRRLMGIYKALMDHVKRLRTHFVYQYEQERVIKSFMEHQEIVNAILAKDPVRAQEALRTHIRNSMEYLKKIIYSNSPKPNSM